MLTLPYSKIDHEYQYSYMLHVITRITGLAKKGKITKSDFINACKEHTISKRSAYRYWEKGAYKNKFIKFVNKDKDYLFITAKHTFELLIEKVPPSIYNEIRTLTDLKDFLHSSRLGRSGVKNKNLSTGIGVRRLANESCSAWKTICNRNNRASKFGLSYKKRMGVYNGILLRLTNVYVSSIRVIRNKYCAVNNNIKRRFKPLINVQKTPLFGVLNSKKTKGQRYATSEDYELINKQLYPKIL